MGVPPVRAERQVTKPRVDGGCPHGAKKRILRAGKELTKERLEGLLAQALVDCYNESEEATGLYTMIEDNLSFPFLTHLLDTEVEVEGLDLNDADEVVVTCRLGRSRQRVPILDLPLPDPPPEGWEWIEAYRYWTRRRR
jgi:hypothetical protein